MGSTRAWLPSRRSTLHQRGARVRRASGHVRSGNSTGIVGRYFEKGMGLGDWGATTIFILSSHHFWNKKPPALREGVGESKLALVQKKFGVRHCHAHQCIPPGRGGNRATNVGACVSLFVSSNFCPFSLWPASPPDSLPCCAALSTRVDQFPTTIGPTCHASQKLWPSSRRAAGVIHR